MKAHVLMLLALFIILGCEKDKVTERDVAVKYKVTFNIDWNSTTFPIDYPSNAHFSKLVGWAHKSNNSFMSLGSYASLGIKKMAEEGSTIPLDDEINTELQLMKGCN